MIETFEKKPEIHLLICTREKEKGESCGPKGAAALRDRLKTWAKEQKLTPQVKVSASLCLGFCENGITACVQPANRWFLKINAQTDEGELKEHILSLLKKSL